MILERWLDEHRARVELDGELIEVPRLLVPAEASPDDVLRVDPAADRVTITIDRDATEAARARSERLVAKLRRRDSGGNLTL